MSAKDLADIRERLARIETKLDTAVALEPRVRKVENRQWYMSGVAGVIAFIAAKINVPLSLPLK